MRGNMRSWSLFAALAFLSGCGGVQIREVRIPIPTPCVAQVASRPDSAFAALPLEAPVFDSVQSLLTDRERMGAYAMSLEALLEACK